MEGYQVSDELETFNEVGTKLFSTIDDANDFFDNLNVSGGS